MIAVLVQKKLYVVVPVVLLSLLLLRLIVVMFEMSKTRLLDQQLFPGLVLVKLHDEIQMN